MNNQAGQCDSSADLTVKKPNIICILDDLKNQTINEGELLELKCKIEGQPVTVTWYKNGEEIDVNEARLQLKSLPENGVYSLQIADAVISDGAAYCVVFINDQGEVSSGSVTYVRALKTEPQLIPAKFLTPLHDQTITEGDTLTLKCQIAGEPQPEMKWFCNDVELTPSAADSRLTIRLALDGTVTLRLRDSLKTDSGKFSVQIWNEAGKAKSQCQVLVFTEAEQPCAPKFIIPLKRTEGIPGETCDFNVKVDGYPKPLLKWYLNKKPLELLDEERFLETDLNDGHYRLTIKEVKDEDFGVIQCVAHNEEGVADCDALFEPDVIWLTRKRVDEGYPPRFNVPLWDRRIPVGLPMSIECHVDAKPPANIQWFKDGVLLNEDAMKDGLEICNTQADGTCCIKIERFEKLHSGNYKCVAKNEHGVADTRANLMIEAETGIKELIKQSAPKFNPPLADVSLKHGEQLQLYCRVDAAPLPANVTWYKDGLMLKTTTRLKLDYNTENGECVLLIDSVEDGDQGAYRCVAANPHGTTNTVCNATMKMKKEEVFLH